MRLFGVKTAPLKDGGRRESTQDDRDGLSPRSCQTQRDRFQEPASVTVTLGCQKRAPKRHHSAPPFNGRWRTQYIIHFVTFVLPTTNTMSMNQDAISKANETVGTFFSGGPGTSGREPFEHSSATGPGPGLGSGTGTGGGRDWYDRLYHGVWTHWDRHIWDRRRRDCGCRTGRRGCPIWPPPPPPPPRTRPSLARRSRRHDRRESRLSPPFSHRSHFTARHPTPR